MSTISRTIIYPTPREHPGKVLLANYMKPLRLSVRHLACCLNVSRGRLDAVVRGRSGIDPQLSMRLGRHFRDPPLYWFELQNAYDIELAYRVYGPSVDLVRPRAYW
ncbi:HigA family addiction module antitoxin [Stenotrophomonas sp.]|uniref:HigA family addiction module antitoxin n=1 Tax=Stenotrophomonas sp. TaxID=69392 RepID=UPI0028B1C88D|nr:HigA family addiction module antitoxin [Stenotrophomonas sp.]